MRSRTGPPSPAGHSSGGRNADREAREELSLTVEELRVALEELEFERRSTDDIQHQLVDARVRYGEIFEFLPDASLVTDRFGTIAEANRAAVSLFGYAPGNLRGKPLAVFVALRDRRAFRARLARLGEGVPSRNWAFRLNCRREIVPVRVSVLPHRSAVGAPPRLHWVIRDVRETAEAERDTRESEARLQAVVETSPEGISVSLLEDGSYQLVNREFLRITGYGHDEVIGRTADDLGIYDDPALQDELAGKLGRGEAMHGLDTRLRARAGSLRTVTLSAKPAVLDGRPCVVSFLRDVTEERRLEDEVHELEHAATERNRLAEIGAVVTSVLHDVANPLAGIVLHARALLLATAGGRDLPYDVREHAEDIVADARHLENLLTDVKDFTGRRAPVRAPVDVAALLRSIRERWSLAAREAKTSFTVEVRGRLPALVTDELRITRILENLLKNAFEAMEDEGPRTVRLEAAARPPGRLRLSVRDSGEGIPEGCEPFTLFQTTKPEGTGLGLAVSRELAEELGGRLSFEPAKPRGTVFHLDLPAEERRAASRPPAKKPSTAGQRRPAAPRRTSRT